MEDLRGSVATVTSYDEWDETFPHLCFGLNTHVSSVTDVNPFELAHGFPVRVPHTFGISSRLQSTSEPGSDDFVLRIQNRFRAAADNVTDAQAREPSAFKVRVAMVRAFPGACSEGAGRSA